MKTNSHPKTKKGLTISVFALVASVILCVGMFLIIKGQNERASEISTKNQIVSNDRENIRAIEKVLKDTVYERSLLDSYVIEPEGSINFIEFVEKLGLQNGVSLEIHTIEPSSWSGANGELLEALTLQLTATGSWANVYNFFSSVELMPYLTKIERVIIEKVVDKKTDSEYWRADIKFSTLKKI